MSAQEYAFIVLAVVGSVAAIAVVTARNVVHAALYLVVTLLSVGGVYLLLGAEFLGWVQILIYVGVELRATGPAGRQGLELRIRRGVGGARR